MQNSKSGRSLAVRVGALTAALSLMLAGGVALASSASAAPGDNNGNGNSSQTKPKPNPNPNNPQKGDPVTTTPNNDTSNTGKFEGSGANNPLFEPGKKVWVCHADTNNGNAANAAAAANGGGNNLGQNGGGNTHAGFSIINISWQAWLSNHDRLHENDRWFEDRAGAEGYCGGGTDELFEAKTTLICAKANTDATFSDSVDVSVPKEFKTQDAANAALTEKLKGYTVSSDSTNPDRTIGCGTPQENTPVQAVMQAQLCEVDGNGFVSGPTTRTGATVSAANDAAAAQAATDALVADLMDYAGKNPNAIIKPFGGFSANWTEQGQKIFSDGCVLPIGVSAAQALAAPLPGTVAGNPKPAKAPAAATLPGTVPAGDGSSIPAVPFWALAMVAAGAIGAAAAGKSLVGSK